MQHYQIPWYLWKRVQICDMTSQQKRCICSCAAIIDGEQSETESGQAVSCGKGRGMEKSVISAVR